MYPVANMYLYTDAIYRYIDQFVPYVFTYIQCFSLSACLPASASVCLTVGRPNGRSSRC